MKMPTLYLSHGGGPCFWMEFGPPFGPQAFGKLRGYLGGLLGSLPERPKAILLISAHWEELEPTISSAAQPEMIYDYYGFPPNTYQLKHPAAGDPALAKRAQDLLAEAGISSRLDPQRGFDHGVFVPMMIVDPKAEIPVVSMSLNKNLSPQMHLAIGRALEPLRDEGVLIIGSGNSFHNLSTFLNGHADASGVFDTWLTQTVETPDPEQRAEKLSHWDQAPAARTCHPREEHLIPLMVVAGAAGADAGRRDYQDSIGNKAVSGYAFGR